MESFRTPGKHKGPSVNTSLSRGVDSRMASGIQLLLIHVSVSVLEQLFTASPSFAAGIFSVAYFHRGFVPYSTDCGGWPEEQRVGGLRHPWLGAHCSVVGFRSLI